MTTTVQTSEPAANCHVPAELSSDVPKAAVPITIIRCRSGLQLFDCGELYEYRDLFRFLVYRSVRVRYAQSALGIGWAILQPLFSMGVFTVIFGNLTKVPSDGVPYALLSFAALVPWTYFSNAVTDGANSLVGEATMISKIYFPRVLLPVSAVAAKLIDFAIASLMLALLLIAFRMPPNFGIVVLPLLILLMVVSAAGTAMWLTALAIQFRDVKYASPFCLQVLMYASPVVYPASLVPEEYRLFYAINPMVGVIEGFRSALLGTRSMPLDLIVVGAITAVAVAVSGAFYFRSRERLFADVA